MESDLYGTPQNSGPGPRYAIFFSEKTLRKSALWLRKVPSTVFSTEGKMDISSILWTLQREQADDKGHPLPLLYSKYTFLLLKIFTLCLIFTHASSLSSWILGKMTEIAQRPTSMIGLEYTPMGTRYHECTYMAVRVYITNLLIV